MIMGLVFFKLQNSQWDATCIR